MIQVSELMSSDVLTLRENASVGRAHAEMRLGRIRHFPVVGRYGDVTGVVSSVDVARALAVEGRGRAVPVKDVMSKTVLTVSEDLPAHEAARLLRRKKINSLPVLSSDGKLVGIITASDFLEIAEQALAGRRLGRRR
ncbi:MAG: CBS domain-containing protein [Myxococcaceae bacterium]|nr:CBS domain-containing protein [Myxococcaceae bacterium]